jgi:hypothetical protein
LALSRIYEDYQENEVGADSKYLGKPLEIYGTIMHIGWFSEDKDRGELVLKSPQ